jgi:hypothetical protein
VESAVPLFALALKVTTEAFPATLDSMHWSGRTCIGHLCTSHLLHKPPGLQTHGGQHAAWGSSAACSSMWIEWDQVSEEHARTIFCMKPAELLVATCCTSFSRSCAALQSPVPLKLLDMPGHVAISSISPPDPASGNATLATYRLVMMVATRFWCCQHHIGCRAFNPMCHTLMPRTYVLLSRAQWCVSCLSYMRVSL